MTDNERMTMRDMVRWMEAAKLRIEQLEQRVEERDRLIEEKDEALLELDEIYSMQFGAEMQRLREQNERMKQELNQRDNTIEEFISLGKHEAQQMVDLIMERNELNRENERLCAEIAEWEDYERFVEAYGGPSRGAYVDAVGLGQWDDGKTECGYCTKRVYEVSGTPFIADAGAVMCERCWNFTREEYIGSHGEDIGPFKAVDRRAKDEKTSD